MEVAVDAEEKKVQIKLINDKGLVSQSNFSGFEQGDPGRSEEKDEGRGN